MSLIKVNGFELGGVPRVVGTITTRAGLEAFARDYRDCCDIAEVRLDEIGIFAGWQDACRRIEAAGRPVMLTLRSKGDGGKSDLPAPARLALLSEAASCATIVDAEHNSDTLAPLAAAVAAAGKALVVSYHDFARTPERAVFESLIAASARPGAIVKIATMVKSEADLQTLNAVLAQPRSHPLCLIGMGAIATCTRTDFPALGSCLTYGYLDNLSAPGQLSAKQLVAHLEQTLPAYRADRLRRQPA